MKLRSSYSPLLAAALLCLLAAERAAGFYDPSVQRWINRDPIGRRGGINLFSFARNRPVNGFDGFGHTFLIDPNADPTFRNHMQSCACTLSTCPFGRQLLDEAEKAGYQITVKMRLDGDGPLEGGSGGDDQNIGMDPTNPNGVGPNNEVALKYPSEMVPNDIFGCAIALAHELGHALHHGDEYDQHGQLALADPEAGEEWVDNVQSVENPVRNCFGIPPRTTYHGNPIPPP
jgi:hypothetical protein